MTMTLALNKPEKLKIRRTKDNKRKRPNSHKRHDPLESNFHGRRDSQYFFKDFDLEWLSINYRKYRAA